MFGSSVTDKLGHLLLTYPIEALEKLLKIKDKIKFSKEDILKNNWKNKNKFIAEYRKAFIKLFRE